MFPKLTWWNNKKTLKHWHLGGILVSKTHKNLHSGELYNIRLGWECFPWSLFVRSFSDERIKNLKRLTHKWHFMCPKPIRSLILQRSIINNLAMFHVGKQRNLFVWSFNDEAIKNLKHWHLGGVLVFQTHKLLHSGELHNITLGWECFPATNPSVYLYGASVTKQ